MKDFNLAFEEQGVIESTELYRVVSWREYNGRKLRCAKVIFLLLYL